MSSLISYTKGMFIERVATHMNNTFPGENWSVSKNQMLLYLDQALAVNLVGSAYAMAKVEGNLAVPDAYYTTYLLPALTKDNVIRKWYSTLPQPPVGLPLGYSITECYFANSVDGQGTQVFLIKAKRASYRDNMPKPFGVSAKIQGSKIIFEASNGASLLNQNCYVTMASTRTESLTDIIALPDDAIEGIFNNVVTKLLQRMQIPIDNIKDDLGSGKKEA